MGMKCFEYMTLTEGVDDLKGKLNMLGEKGWELVDILPGSPPEAFFKRRRSDKVHGGSA